MRRYLRQVSLQGGIRRPESLNWARWAEGFLTRLGPDCPLIFRRRLLETPEKQGLTGAGRNPETAGQCHMKIKHDPNDLCKSLKESVEHSKFMVLCIQPWTVLWTQPVSSIWG